MKVAGSKTRLILGVGSIVTLVLLAMAVMPNAVRASQRDDSASASPKVNRAELPLSFEPNLGQSEPQVKFLSRGSGYDVFLTSGEAVLLLKKAGTNQKAPDSQSAHTAGFAPNFSPRAEREQVENHTLLTMRLVGANRGAAVKGVAKFAGVSNYFIGNDPAKWHANIPNYAKVHYENIYPGVDLMYYGNQRQLEYDFVVSPAADPAQISLDFVSQPALPQSRLENGDLIISIDGSEVRFHKPIAYQNASAGDVKIPVEARYVLEANNRIGFEVGHYDHSQPLVIDPVLSYSTYLGGSGTDNAFGVAVDASGNIVVAGVTTSPNFPTTLNAFQGNLRGTQNAFVTKFNPSGSSLIYSTYIGGGQTDYCEGLALDSAGNAYITGFTASGNFPTKNAIQPNQKGHENVFLSKFDPNGNLLFSTYYGGSNYDQAYGIAVDSSGVYVAGDTNSSNYPTKNAFQPTIVGNQDAFLTKFAVDDSSVMYSTFLGGTGGGSTAYSVAVDSAQSAYVAGQTHSPSFPTMNPYQPTYKASFGTVFLTKFTSAGNALVYSTYLGGSVGETAGSVTVDSSGSAYISGGTQSFDFPTQNPFQSKFAGAYDVFVTKFNSSGNGLVYSTYIGGTQNELGDAITVDSSGNAHVAGYVLSTNFPIANAFQPKNGGNSNFDAFVLELNSAGNALIYSSYLGGSGVDFADSIALDSQGNTYVAGGSNSLNFPVTGNAFQGTYAGGNDDAFLSQVSAVTTFPLTVTLAGTGTGTVTSSPSGINCGVVCSTTFASGTVTLTAAAGAGSSFAGWSGACSGNGTCVVNLTSAQSVTATFSVPVFSLLNNLGTNSGNDPTNPTWPGIIAQGRDGNLYTTAPKALGGNDGAAFSVTPAGTLNWVTPFGVGGAPQSGLTLGNDGNLYGTTYGCSVGGDGTIFQITATGTVSPLYSFTGGTDGKCPTAPPIQGTDGNFYGTATSSSTSGVFGSLYKFIKSTSKFKLLHDFSNTDGASPAAPLVQGNTGLLYGVTQAGGLTGLNDGNVFDIATTGSPFSVLLTFAGTNGQNSVAPLIQGSDGNFYGTTVNGGANGLGEVFKMTSGGGKVTVLYSFAGTGDGAFPYGGLVQASDGNFYGTTSQTTSTSGCGTIFRVSGGVLSTLFTFPANGASGCNPQATLVQHTNGTLYGDTNTGGSTVGGACALGCGTFFSFNVNLPPFIILQSTSGSAGSQVGILGQGFNSSSVVAFNGVPATAVTLTGTTYLTATVPAGASTGLVTVTTAGTTLTSLVKYVVHNSWTSGAPIPVPVAAAAAGFVNGSVYVIGGFQTSGGGPVNNNQVYNPSTSSWKTAAPIPTPVFGAASAVSGNNLFIFGGFSNSSGTPSNLVQVYNVPTNSWSTGATMPTARGSAAAVLNTAAAIFVMGGTGSSGLVNNLEEYAPGSNTWTELAPLPIAKSGAAGGLVGAIVAADGITASGDTGDNEAYNVSNNSWTSLTADPNPRNGSCSGAFAQFYVAGGLNNSNPQVATSVTESYNFTSNTWTSLAAMPTAAFSQASASGNNMLYCIGGQTSVGGPVINNVQIYQQ